MADVQSVSTPKRLGAGRSGEVFLIETPDVSIARKVFVGDSITKIIHYFFFGAPNAYIWNEDAIRASYYRRKILKLLVQYWFDSRLKVSDAIGWGWNESAKAYQLDTEFVPGEPVALHHPLSMERDAELPTLVHQIMRPLQRNLVQAGLDGLVWQAGKGNPVALNNFLLVDFNQEDYQFAWIDLESGVPALIPLNPLSLFSFYLPKSFHHGAPLFDDIDTPKLRKYILKNEPELRESLGILDFSTLLDYVGELDYHQTRWKSMSRSQRSLAYHCKKGKISEEEAAWYSEHRLQWYGREFKRLIPRLLTKIFVALPSKIVKKLTSIDYKGLWSRLWKLLFSPSYRLNLARNYITARALHWRERGQLTEEETDTLLERLDRDSSSEYLSDFGVHLGMKVFVKGTEYLILPLLFAAGLFNEIVFAILLITGGPISRTVYTGFRMVQAAGEGKELPWVAFILGMIPMLIGNIAYPCQMIYSASGKRGKVAKFIIYDAFARIGDKFPIWGGEDTLTEHTLNRWGDRLIRWVGWLSRRFA